MPDPLNPTAVVEGAEVKGKVGVYILGCFDRRITFYSQQVRALSLVHALKALQFLADDPSIAVIGAGAAGLTAAAAASLSMGGQVHLYESADVLLKLQSATDRRRLDPFIYDWPFGHTTDPTADLPILDWEAGPSQTVRQEVVLQFEHIVAASGGRLTKHLKRAVTSIVQAADGSYDLAIHDHDVGADTHQNVDRVILAFGFGLEDAESIAGIQGKSYWSTAGVPANEFQGRPNPRFLISGNGDGALIDFVAAAAANFDHSTAIRTITRQTTAEAKAALRRIEKEARDAHAAGHAFDIYARYDADLTGLIGDPLVDAIAAQLRAGVHVALQTRSEELFTIDSAVLNRFAVFVTTKALNKAAGRGFSHIPTELSRVAGYVAAMGQPIFLLEGGGQQYEFDEVVVRHGTKTEVVRQPFAGLIGTYPADHKAWLKRLGQATLVPTLSDDARQFYQEMAQSKAIPLSPRRQRLAADNVPQTIHVSVDGPNIRWAGDLTVDHIAMLWEDAGAYNIVLDGSPAELGPVSGAVLRIAAHAPHVKVHADAIHWRELWRGMTSSSSHSLGLTLPEILGGDMGGGAVPRTTAPSSILARRLHARLDAWLLDKIDAHLRGYLQTQDDPSGAINLEIAADLRAAMTPVWDDWKLRFQDDRALLNRYLRLVACATDEDGEAIQAVPGKKKLSALIRSTALSLAVASCWHQTMPRPDRPGNLRRATNGIERNGHGCAADRIDGRNPVIAVANHSWKTHFVLFAREGNSGLSTGARVALTSVPPRQPSLADTEGSGPMLMWIDGQLIVALEQGLAQLEAFLTTAENAHTATLAAAVVGEPA